MAGHDPPTLKEEQSAPDLGPEDGSLEIIDNPEDLIERDPLIMLFGDHPRARIVMALLDAYPQPMNPSSIVEKARISRQSWYRHRDQLVKTGLIKEVGQAGNSPLYALVNRDEDRRVEWLQKLRDWTAVYQREGRKPTENDR
jgi:hypothetical protein